MAETLIDAPKTARRGEIITLKVLISHPMETGYRREISGAVIPRNIITRFTCQYDGAEVFRADLYPAMAANPYITFSLVAGNSGPIEFRWTGDGAFDHVEAVHLTVAA